MFHRVIAVFGLLVAFLGMQNVAWAQSLRIGYIDGVRIERDSKRAQAVSEALKREFSAREQELNDLQGKLAALQAQLDKMGANGSAAEIQKRQREFQSLSQRFDRTRRNFEEDLDRRKTEERQKFLRDVTAVVQRIAEAQKLDLVVQDAVWASKALDITDAVIKALEKPPAR